MLCIQVTIWFIKSYKKVSYNECVLCLEVNVGTGKEMCGMKEFLSETHRDHDSHEREKNGN